MKRDIIDYEDRPKLIYLYAWYEADGTIGHITYRGKTYEAKYVGQAFMDGLEQRQRNGKGYLQNGKQPKIELAIKKYGWNNRRQMILTSNIKTNIEADSMEDFWIDRLDTLNNGLNAILNRILYGEYQLGDKIRYADYLEERFDIRSEAHNNPETIKKHSESHSIPITGYYFKDENHTEIETTDFKSATDAQEKTGIHASSIAQFINGTNNYSYVGKINGQKVIWSYDDKPYTDSEAIEMLNNAYKSKGKGIKCPRRPIIVINVLTNEAKPYEGQRKVSLKLNISQGNISRSCNGIYHNSHLYDNWLCYFQQDWNSFSQEQQQHLIDEAIKLYNSRKRDHHGRILAVNRKTGEETILADMDKAIEFVGVRKKSNISKACYGKLGGKDGHWFKNYYWYYIDDNDNIIPDEQL